MQRILEPKTRHQMAGFGLTALGIARQSWGLLFGLFCISIRAGHHKGRFKLVKVKAHVNKYAHLAPPPKRKYVYDSKDKRIRYLPVFGKPGETVKAGFRILYHGRRYILKEDVIVSSIGQTSARFEIF